MIEFTFKDFRDGHTARGQYGNVVHVHGVRFEGDEPRGVAHVELPVKDVHNLPLLGSDGMPCVTTASLWVEVCQPDEEPKTHFPVIFEDGSWIELAKSREYAPR